MTSHLHYGLQPGKLVSLRGREWVVLPSDDPDLLVVKPLGGSDDEIAGIYLPLRIPADLPADARFPLPAPEDLGDIKTVRALYDAARLAFRNGAGPFRSLAKLSFRPRCYQLVPLIMALRLDRVRLLIADDVGVGKTVEALLILKELLARRRVKRFAIICLPHLCEQWQEELRAKLDIEAVIIRSSTQARLDRQIQGDTSVYEYYPYQIISIDFIKSESRREVFIEQCPELIIVDEAHTCARPAGASASQQQRYHLLSRLAARADKHLVLLTATPHSGKAEEFQSLLGLLRAEFEPLDLPTATSAQRSELAAHFIQRKRADITKWMGEDTAFPERETFEVAFELSDVYARCFDDLLEFVRKLVAPDSARPFDRPLCRPPTHPHSRRRVQYWTALALLRGVMSSPAAGVTMLKTRLTNLAQSVGEGTEADADSTSDDTPLQESLLNPVRDGEYGAEIDTLPTQLMEQQDWSDHQRRLLREFATRLETLAGPRTDLKLAALWTLLKEWLSQGFNPVIFCRYISTAEYIGTQLKPLLQKTFPKLDLQVVTSDDGDEVRRERIQGMAGSPQRILIATDCLSEGINLQELFTAVLHYDLPWNPNRLEQREGRVDRFGQSAPKVKACLLYGSSNPIDGIVLDVLLRKVREIKRATGINVPFPEDSQSIIDTITQALLLNPDRKIQVRRAGADQLAFGFGTTREVTEAKTRISHKVDKAAEREKASRSIFAQHAIRAQEIEKDLQSMDEAIGDPYAVEQFVVAALTELLGVQITPDRGIKGEQGTKGERGGRGYSLITANLPARLRELLPPGLSLPVSFHSPTPEGYHYLGRNHRFVEQLCQLLMANTLNREGKRAARASVIRTPVVSIKTSILLFRCRNVIEQGRSGMQIVAEEMLLWGWKGVPDDHQFIEHTEARNLLYTARASAQLSPERQAATLANDLELLETLGPIFSGVAEQQSRRLVEAHERFSALMDKQRFQVVYPVLPMDLLGLYILLPEILLPEVPNAASP